MARKDEIIEDEDDEEIEVEAEDAEEESGLPKWMPMAVIAVAVMGFGGLAWLAMDSGSEQASYKEVPVIKAEEGDMKEKPSDPGGMKVAGQGREIFDAAAGKDVAEVEESAEAVDGASVQAQDVAAPEKAGRATLLSEDETKEKKVEKIATAKEPVAEKPLHVEAQGVESERPTEIKTATVATTRQAANQNYDAPSSKLAGDARDKDMKSQAVAEAKSPSAGDVKIQVGAYRSEQEAIAAWKKTASGNKDILTKKVFSIQKAQVEGKGIFYRLQIGGFASGSEASTTCKTLSSRKTNCFVVR